MEIVLRTLLLYYSLAVAGLSDSVVGQLLAQNRTQSKFEQSAVQSQVDSIVFADLRVNIRLCVVYI